MRRIVLICLLLILPTQWTRAAVASACRHESGTAARHLGPHAHEHAAAATAAQADADADTAGPGFDTDCATCHGHGLTAMISVAALPPCRPGSLVPGTHTRHLVDRVPEHPLRPPPSHLA
jgi:cytochrome c553